jgi:serine protease AprX
MNFQILKSVGLKIFLLLSIFFFNVSVNFSQNVSDSPKIDVALISGKPEVQQDIIIQFKKQGNTIGSRKLSGKNAKTKYVFESLTELADSDQKNIRQFLEAKNISFRSYYLVNAISLKADLFLMAELAEFEEIEKIIQDAKYQVAETFLVRSNGERSVEWGVAKINAPQVWQLGHTGQGVVVAGHDTGYEWNHPAIISQYRGWNDNVATHNYNWHDAIHANNPNNSGNNPCGYSNPVPCDDHNHGTHTMGTMIGDDGGNNQIGVAPGAKWIACRNMERGWGQLSTYLECFEWFLAPYAYGENPMTGEPDFSPHVINNSWYCSTTEGCNASNFGFMNTAVNNLKNAGIVVVVSTGNTGSGCSTVTGPPAFFENSFSVGATNSMDQIAGFSSRGPVTIDNSNRLKPNVSAPGVDVYSSIRNGVYGFASGTSMAGPHVAGAVALIISANPDLAGEVELIESILEQTATHPPNSETCGGIPANTYPNNTFGYGRIDVLQAVNMAKNLHVNKMLQLENGDLSFDGSQNSIVLRSPDNNYYKLSIDLNGNVNTTLENLPAQNSTFLINSSINLTLPASGIVLTDEMHNLRRIKLNNSGGIITESISNPTTQHIKSQNRDVIISNSSHGIMMKNSDNKCYLVKVNNAGIIFTSPVLCIE